MEDSTVAAWEKGILIFPAVLSPSPLFIFSTGLCSLFCVGLEVDTVQVKQDWEFSYETRINEGSSFSSLIEQISPHLT